MSNISSEMKNKNNFIDEINNWKLKNNFKLNLKSPKSNIDMKNVIPKSTSFKGLNELNVMQRTQSASNQITELDKDTLLVKNKENSA